MKIVLIDLNNLSSVRGERLFCREETLAIILVCAKHSLKAHRQGSKCMQVVVKLCIKYTLQNPHKTKTGIENDTF